MSINVTVANLGDTSEIFDLTAYANTTAIDTLTGITLISGDSTTIAFTWNTTGFAYGNYTISAYVWPVPGEIDTSDNTYIDGTVKITILGDINGDGFVNLFDLLVVRDALDSVPGDPNWNSNADLNDDGFINIFDLLIVRDNLG